MQRLREIRIGRGLSQAGLSEKTGVSEFTISELEVGKRPNPRPSTLRKLAEGLNVEVTDLLGEPELPKVTAPPEPTERGEERREETESALARLLNIFAARGEALAEKHATSSGEFFPVQVAEFASEAHAMRVLHDREPPVIQNASRVREAKERLEAAERRLATELEAWSGPTRLSPDQWSERGKFGARRTETQRSLEASEDAATGDQSDASSAR